MVPLLLYLFKLFGIMLPCLPTRSAAAVGQRGDGQWFICYLLHGVLFLVQVCLHGRLEVAGPELGKEFDSFLSLGHADHRQPLWDSQFSVFLFHMPVEADQGIITAADGAGRGPNIHPPCRQVEENPPFSVLSTR